VEDDAVLHVRSLANDDWLAFIAADAGEGRDEHLFPDTDVPDDRGQRIDIGAGADNRRFDVRVEAGCDVGAKVGSGVVFRGRRGVVGRSEALLVDNPCDEGDDSDDEGAVDQLLVGPAADLGDAWQLREVERELERESAFSLRLSETAESPVGLTAAASIAWGDSTASDMDGRPGDELPWVSSRSGRKRIGGGT